MENLTEDVEKLPKVEKLKQIFDLPKQKLEELGLYKKAIIGESISDMIKCKYNIK